MTATVLAVSGMTICATIAAVLIRARLARSLVERAFDDALQQGEWPDPAELLDAFTIAADGSSETELKRLAHQLSRFSRRLDGLPRRANKGELT